MHQLDVFLLIFLYQRISILVHLMHDSLRSQTAQTDDCTKFCIFFSFLQRDATQSAVFLW